MTPDDAVDQDITYGWLRVLYRDMEEGWLTLFSLDRTTGDRHTDWFGVDDLEAAAVRAAQRSASCCVWFGVATRHERLVGKRGGAEHCAQVPALWVDIDIAGDVHAAEGLPTTCDEAAGIIERFPAQPTAVIHSGHGLQAWWVLTEAADADEVARVLPRWNATWQALAAPRHIDNVFDLPRVMRLPGTLNRKTDPVPVKILEANWDHLVELSDLNEQLQDPPPTPTPKPATRKLSGSEGLPGQVFNGAHTGAEILTRMGFEFDHTDTQGDHYRRPGKAKGQGSSATVFADDKHTTIWSDTVTAQYPALEVRRPYDPFGLYACVAHAGDHRAAAAELEQQGYGTLRSELPPDSELFSPVLLGGQQAQRIPARVNPSTGEMLTSRNCPVMPDELWAARDELGVIRDAARSARVAPDAVLGVVLARVAVETPHSLKLPAVTGAPCGLTYYTALVATPGAGKSGAQRIGAQLVPASLEHPEVPTGSGEGLLEQLFGMVDEEQSDGKTRQVRRQVRHGVHVVIGEGTQLFEIGNRSGSTTMSVIREAFTDGVLGNTNASEERRRIIPAGQATFGVCLAVQPEKSGPLLNDVDAGTPQRFAWFVASDPNAPDTRPHATTLDWNPPDISPTSMVGPYRRHLMDVDPVILAEIDTRRLEVLRGISAIDAMDEHRDLVRLKTAALLAILAHRMNVNIKDWALAGIILDTSTAVRDWTRTRLAAADAVAEERYRCKLAGRSAHADTAERRRITNLAVGVISRKVRRDGSVNRRSLARVLPSKYRAVVSLDEVIAEATTLGFITAEGDAFRPGKKVFR